MTPIGEGDVEIKEQVSQDASQPRVLLDFFDIHPGTQPEPEGHSLSLAIGKN